MMMAKDEHLLIFGIHHPLHLIGNCYDFWMLLDATQARPYAIRVQGDHAPNT